MTELPQVTSSEEKSDNQSDQAETESDEGTTPVDRSRLRLELRRDLESMRDEHKQIIKEINSIKREFKELISKAQEQNALSSDFALPSMFDYTTDYSTETDENVSCIEGDINEAIYPKFNSNQGGSRRESPYRSLDEEPQNEDLENFSKIVDEQRKLMFSKRGSHFLNTDRRGSSLIIDLDRNRRLNGRLSDEEHHQARKKTLKSMSRRNSAMPHVQYFSPSMESRRGENSFENDRLSSTNLHHSRLTQNHHGYHDSEKALEETPLTDSRQVTSGGASSHRRLKSKRGSMSVEVGRVSHEYHNGHRRASEMLPNQLGALFSQNKGRRWAPELRHSIDRRRTSVVLEEDEHSYQLVGKRETNL